MSTPSGIGITMLLNLILVREGLRPAFLLQPAEFMEATGKDPQTKSVMAKIRKQFPDLKQSEDYTTYQGVIIAKKSYNGRKDISLQEMGRILGYPCAGDFGGETPVGMSVIVDLKNPATGRDYLPLTLIANACADESKKAEFEAFCRKAEKILRGKDARALLGGDYDVKGVRLEVETAVSEETVIDALVTGTALKPDEKDKLSNAIFNMGFPLDAQFAVEDNFDPANPFHRGLVAGLLLISKHDRAAPFYPVQKHGEKVSAAFDEVTADFGNAVAKLIKRRSAGTAGGRGKGRRTQKQQGGSRRKTSRSRRIR